MKNFVQVYKFELREGEELGELVRNIHQSLARHRERTNKSMFLRGIFKGFVITQDLENGQFLRMTLKRDKQGLIELGESVAVRQAFVPIGSKGKTEKNEELDFVKLVELPEMMLVMEDGEVTDASIEEMKVVAKTMSEASSNPPEMLELEIQQNLWGKILK